MIFLGNLKWFISNNKKGVNLTPNYNILRIKFKNRKLK